jgi:hypothetical protein
MAAISDKRATDERVTCLRIFADANGGTHMEDVDIALQPRKLFKDNPPLRLSDNFAAAWFNICHIPSGVHQADWHNPPQRLLVLWLTGEVEFETSDGNIRRLPAAGWRIRRARGTFPVILPRASSWSHVALRSIKANHAVGTSALGGSRHKPKRDGFSF